VIILLDFNCLFLIVINRPNSIYSLAHAISIPLFHIAAPVGLNCNKEFLVATFASFHIVVVLLAAGFFFGIEFLLVRIPHCAVPIIYICCANIHLRLFCFNHIGAASIVAVELYSIKVAI
jgi:hypothetical protein